MLWIFGAMGVITVALILSVVVMGIVLKKTKSAIAIKESEVFNLCKYIYLHTYDHYDELKDCGLSTEEIYEIVCKIEGDI